MGVSLNIPHYPPPHRLSYLFGFGTAHTLILQIMLGTDHLHTICIDFYRVLPYGTYHYVAYQACWKIYYTTNNNKLKLEYETF